MAASAQLMTYLRGLGLTDAQIQSLLAAGTSGDAGMNENDIAAAGRRLAAGGGLPTPNNPNQPTPGAGGGTGTPPSGAPADFLTNFGPKPGGQDPPANFPTPAAWGIPTALPTDAAGVQAYNANIMSGLLSGAIPSPYAYAAAQRGQNPDNRPTSMDGGAGDGSPEARLPSMAYAGTVGASTLTPEQAASIQYNTPALQQFLATQPNGAPLLTANTLQNYRQSGSYAGSPTDLDAAIITTHQNQFARVQAANPMLTWDQYVRSLDPASRDQVERITGAQTTTGNVASQNPNYRAPTAPYYTQGAASPAAQPGAILDMNSPSGYTTPPMTPTASGGWQMPAGAQTGSATVAPPGTPLAGAPPAPVDYSAAIAQNQKYVANISAVPEAQRTAEQKASLAAAQRKILDYSSR